MGTLTTTTTTTTLTTTTTTTTLTTTTSSTTTAIKTATTTETIRKRQKLFEESFLKTAARRIGQDPKEIEKGRNGETGKDDGPHVILSTKHVDVNLQSEKEGSSIGVLKKEKKKRKNGEYAIPTTK